MAALPELVGGPHGARRIIGFARLVGRMVGELLQFEPVFQPRHLVRGMDHVVSEAAQSVAAVAALADMPAATGRLDSFAATLQVYRAISRASMP